MIVRAGHIEAPGLDGPWSPGALAGRLLGISGQLPVDHSTGAVVGARIGQQVDQCMANIRGILEMAGGTLASLLKVTVFLRAYSDFPDMNAAYSRFFRDVYPARSCVTVADLPVIGGVTVLCIIDGLAVIEEAGR